MIELKSKLQRYVDADVELSEAYTDLTSALETFDIAILTDLQFQITRILLARGESTWHVGFSEDLESEDE